MAAALAEPLEIALGFRACLELSDQHLLEGSTRTEVQRLLEGAEGYETSPPAPPEGLFLSRVDYPADAGAEPPKRRRGPQLVQLRNG